MPDFDADVYVYKVAQSKSIDFNNGTITQARMTLTYTGSGQLDLFLSADGGEHWETVTNNTLHAFTITGTDLRWKIGAAGDFIVTEIKIDQYH
jgi:hypothetical protein